MRSPDARFFTLRFFAGLALLLVIVSRSPAQSKPDVSGRYTCAELKVRGQVKPCQSTPLVLKSNGRYEIEGREGEYSTKGNWLLLTSADQHGRGRIGPGHTIVFRYRCGKGSCEVKFERRIVELGDKGLG